MTSAAVQGLIELDYRQYPQSGYAMEIAPLYDQVQWIYRFLDLTIQCEESKLRAGVFAEIDDLATKALDLLVTLPHSKAKPDPAKLEHFLDAFGAIPVGLSKYLPDVLFAVGNSDTASQIESDAEDARKQANKYVADLAQFHSTGETLLKSMQMQGNRVVLANIADTFLTASKWNVGIAIFWLIVGICIARELIFYAENVIDQLSRGQDSFSIHNIPLSVARLVIGGVAMYLMSVCFRNAAASQHNATHNQHRSNAIRSYGVLVESTSNDSTKEVLMAQAIPAIFAAQDTGYLPSGNDLPTSASELINKVLNK